MIARVPDDRLRVLVSGAAGSVGLACAAAFAARGAQLILCDHDGVGLAAAGDSLHAFSRYCDVVSESSVAIFAAEIAAKFPSIDVLINAAGRRYIRSLGMVQMSRALLPLLRRAEGNRLIVNVMPSGGFVADGMFPNCGSRESFDRLTEALAEQVRGTAISVASIAPRLTSPRLSQPAEDEANAYRLEQVDAIETAEHIAALVSAERPGWEIHSRSASKRRYI